MNAITDLLKRLPKAKSSADFEAAVADAEREYQAARAALAELEARREETLFSGGDLGKLDAEIAEAERQIKTLGIAMEGARKRHLGAAEREHQTALEAEHKEALKIKGELRQVLIEFAAAAQKVAECATRYRELWPVLMEHNKKMMDNQRADLSVQNPLSDLARDSGRHVPNPVANLFIPDFWPPHPDGPVLLELKK